MKVDQLQLTNIGCYTERAFDFKNLTVIYGENRTGKSTLVYALFFALFGGHLNQHLKDSDLTRIGEPYGTTRLVFFNNGIPYKIVRATGGIPELLQKSSENSDWEPAAPSSSQDLQNFIPISSEMAALTSFFREGELIYFLRDIPKYNNTLLQNMLRMDNVFITHSRFKKALGMAREEKRRVQDTLPKIPVYAKDVTDALKLVEDLENKLQKVDKEYQALSTIMNPENFLFLQKRVKEISDSLNAGRKQRDEHPDLESLNKRLSELKTEVAQIDYQMREKENLQRQLGKNEKESADLENETRILEGYGDNPHCRRCGQPISQTLFEELSQKNIDRKKVLVAESKQIEGELSRIRKIEESRGKLEKNILDISNRIREIESLDKQIRKLDKDLNEAETAVKGFMDQNQNVMDTEKKFQRKKELENIRSQLQKRIINAKVAAKQFENDYCRFDDIQKGFQKAERGVLVCETATKALDNAIRELNSTLLAKVRENLRSWAGHFSFLSRFDINLTTNQLLPIVQARGYQYKLNQMSKSERIFLYLMLKLAIGDAMTHMGVFILDDPADGLDQKRKEMLAHLLTAISEKRQILVTSNDLGFANMFGHGHRINL